ncbi:hypothetical protein L7F22_025267, partial [Adiantum nelumboides]|nr:hypothetical protein [Adiantum nelumboides]
MGGGIIDNLDHIEMTMEMDCILQEKVGEFEVDPCEDDLHEMCVDGPCILSMEESTIVEAINVIDLESSQSSFEVVG